MAQNLLPTLGVQVVPRSQVLGILTFNSKGSGCRRPGHLRVQGLRTYFDPFEFRSWGDLEL